MDRPVKYLPQPSWRKPAGIFAIIGLISVIGWLIGSLSGWLAALAFPLQMFIYALAGVIWIAPLRPLLAWMETGRWRP